MSKTYTTTAFVLKRRDYQEHDRLFCLYTKDYGKIDVLAKGTKKITSKLNSYLEPFYLIQVMIAKGKGFDKLANCNLLNGYHNLRQDLLGFALINYLAEVTDNLIIGQTQNSDKFDLLLNALDVLEPQIGKKDKVNLLLLANIYGLKLLALLGYQPEIKRCLNCHRGILLTKKIFDFTKGGIICEDCKKVCLLGDYILVSDQVIKLLQLGQEKELNFFTNVVIDQETLKQFNLVVNRLLLVNMERPLRTIEFLNKLP